MIDLWEFLAVLECLTDEWWDHSASDNLYVRKMHYEEKRMAGYSFWPEQGWDGLFRDLADAVTENGGEVRMGTPAERVIIENHEVKGVAVARQPRILPNEVFEEEIVECDAVVSTLPVWDVLNVVPEWELPDWYAGQIRFLAQPHFKVTWLGLYLATDEPAAILDRKELGTWLHAPITRTPGFIFEQTAYDPSSAPAGKYLYVMGAVVPGSKGSDQRYLLEMFEKFEQEIGIMYPVLAKPVVAPAAPRPQPVVRRDPEAGPRRHVPAALARAERRRPLLRERDVPQPRHRRRPRLTRRPHRRRGHPRQAPARLRGDLALLSGRELGDGQHEGRKANR